MPYKSLDIQRKDSARKRKILGEIKNVPCMDCGKKYPSYVMDFDHRNPKDKVLNLSKVFHWGLKKLLDEAKKCDIVCSNCHRERTFGRGYTNKKPSMAK